MSKREGFVVGKLIPTEGGKFKYAIQSGDGLPIMNIEKKTEDETDYIELAGPNGENVVPQGGGGGGTITVDDEMSDVSENPVQNKVITAALAGKANPRLIRGGTVTTIGYAGEQSVTFDPIELSGTKKYIIMFYITAGDSYKTSDVLSYTIVGGNIKQYNDGDQSSGMSVNVSKTSLASGNISVRITATPLSEYGPTLLFTITEVDEIENEEITCFIEGTKITVKDVAGNVSEKNIEDITTNDLVAFWDPSKGRLTKTRVIIPTISGECTEYERIFFSDGTTVDVYGNQRFWDVDKDKCVNYTKIEKGDRFCKANGDIVKFDHIEHIISDHPVKHYTIIAFRDRYLANGIQVSDTRDKFYPMLNQPEYIEYWDKLNDIDKQKLINAWVSGMNRRNWRNSELYINTLTPLNNQKFDQLLIIENNKKQLEKLDPMTNKYVEGEITEKQWEQVKAERKSLRNAINAAEAEIENIDISIKNAENSVLEQIEAGINRKYKGKFIGKDRAVLDDVDTKKKK